MHWWKTSCDKTAARTRRPAPREWARLLINPLLSERGGGTAANRIKRLLRGGDESGGGGGIVAGNLGGDLVLEGFQFVQGRDEVAAIKGGSGRLERGDERTLVLAAKVRVIDEGDALSHRVAGGDNADGGFAAGHSATITDAQHNRMAAEVETIGHDRASERRTVELAANFTTRMSGGVNVDVPQAGAELGELLGNGETAGAVHERHSSIDGAGGTSEGRDGVQRVKDCSVDSARSRPMDMSGDRVRRQTGEADVDRQGVA